MENWLKIKNNSELKETFKKRAKVIREIRNFFDNDGFLEVKTPILVALPGMEPNLHPFKTFVYAENGKKLPAYLITSPEYAMKKLLTAGFDKIYEITSAFRNSEELSQLHNTEFSILEWYTAPGDYKTIMNDVENMIFQVNLAVNNRKYIVREGKKIDLSTPWSRKTVAELFDEYIGLDLFLLINNKDNFSKLANKKGLLVDNNDSWEDIFYKLFLTYIEPKLGWDKPVFVYDYPKSMAALAQINKDDNRVAERVEFYIAGLELGNGFSELNNADEQEKRLIEEREERIKNGMTDIYDVDYSFIKALREGMPQAGGIAVGIDRIVMLLLEKEHLSDILLFPQKEMFKFE
jgi:lysyl-tRNA synthetase class 2